MNMGHDDDRRVTSYCPIMLLAEPSCPLPVGLKPMETEAAQVASIAANARATAHVPGTMI